MRQIIKRVAAWLWPPACAACHARLPWDAGQALCAACYRELPWWRRDEILPPDMPAAVDGFDAPFIYDGVVREMILRLKFKDGLALATILAGWMVPYVPTGADVLLVPVPSHPKRLRWRGYNHAALLVRVLATRCGVEFSLGALARLRESEAQARRTRKQRLQLRGTDFAADAAVVAGKAVVLVDDIVTTGGTARACALALRRAGAARVHVVALAYTPPAREIVLPRVA